METFLAKTFQIPFRSSLVAWEEDGLVLVCVDFSFFV